MAAAKPTSQTKVPILDRALTLMEYLLDHPRGLGMSEIANQLGFPKNSVYRILATLEKHGYVNRESDTKRYVLSRKLFSMAYSGPEEKSLMENAVDVMRDLRDEVKETVLISVLSGDESLVLEQMPGLYPFRFVVEPGTRLSIHASSHGKVMWAYLNVRDRDALLDGLRLTRFTDRTITTKAAMRAELKGIRKYGYALDLAEGGEGVRCVSAPILNQQGVAVAALTTTGPAFRMPDRQLAAMGRCVKAHADKISMRLGYGLI